MDELFSPQRLTLARERRGMFRQELAARVGVTAVTVSRWENGKTVPPPDTVVALARVLEFPPDYFFGDAPPRLVTAAFRSLARMTAKQRNMALAAGSQAVALDAWIAGEFERPAPNVPDLMDLASNAEAAADAVRAAWGLGYQPIGNLIHRMELNGVRVFSLVQDGSEIDAFSDWQNDTPYVFLNTTKTAERIRMDASHELGHLALHAHIGGPTTRIEEDQAQNFAAAFLMPATAFIASAPRVVTLETVIHAKQQWGVSALAYIYRLHRLGRLTEYVYRALCIQIKSSYGKREPGAERQKESSQVLAKVLGTPNASGVRKQIAHALRIQLRDLDEMTFGLTLTPVIGNGGPVSAPQAGPRALRLM
jgi:Zn-dependent peptidase ImmA (M78 family)/DNA-binding XRE family transcriptional regulator